MALKLTKTGETGPLEPPPTKENPREDCNKTGKYQDHYMADHSTLHYTNMGQYSAS